MNVFWSIFSIAVLGLTCLACIELPRRRVDERFESSEPAEVVWQERSAVPCRVTDISLSGARLRAGDWASAGESGCYYWTMERYAFHSSGFG